MENNSTAYQLAHTYHSFIKTHLKDRYSLDQFPSISSQSLHSPQNLLFPTFLNIFTRNNDKPDTGKPQNLSKISYKLVGAHEVRSYQQKLDKKRHNQISINKPPDSAVSLPQSSHCRISQDPTRLTKDQVIKFSPPTNQITHILSEQAYLSSKNRDEIQKTMNENAKGKDEATLMMDSAVYKSQQHSFYVSKIKSRLQDYKKNWQKIIQSKENIKVHKHRRFHKKLTSLLQRVDDFRQSTEQRQQYTLHEQQDNIQPSLWSSILRSSKSLQHLHKKQLQHVVKVGMSCIGKQKLRKEVAWIQQKDIQGCYFKRHLISSILMNK